MKLLTKKKKGPRYYERILQMICLFILVFSIQHLNCAGYLDGSSPPDNQHPADLTLFQSLQSWLGDVSFLQKNNKKTTISAVHDGFRVIHLKWIQFI